MLSSRCATRRSDVQYSRTPPGRRSHGVSPLKDTADSALHAFKRRALAQGALSGASLGALLQKLARLTAVVKQRTIGLRSLTSRNARTASGTASCKPQSTT